MRSPRVRRKWGELHRGGCTSYVLAESFSDLARTTRRRRPGEIRSPGSLWPPPMRYNVVHHELGSPKILLRVPQKSALSHSDSRLLSARLLPQKLARRRPADLAVPQAMAAIDTMPLHELKRTLRHCAVNPVQILGARTKEDLVELAKSHGIFKVPDEWTIEKIKAKIKLADLSTTAPAAAPAAAAVAGVMEAAAPPSLQQVVESEEVALPATSKQRAPRPKLSRDLSYTSLECAKLSAVAEQRAAAALAWAEAAALASARGTQKPELPPRSAPQDKFLAPPDTLRALPTGSSTDSSIDEAVDDAEAVEVISVSDCDVEIAAATQSPLPSVTPSSAAASKPMLGRSSSSSNSGKPAPSPKQSSKQQQREPSPKHRTPAPKQRAPSPKGGAPKASSRSTVKKSSRLGSSAGSNGGGAAAKASAAGVATAVPTAGMATEQSKAAQVSNVTTSPTGSASGSGMYTARTKLKMRATHEMSSPAVGELPAGSKVRVLQHKELADGTRRARIALESQSGQLRRGWISWLNKDGTENLISDDASQADASAATTAVAAKSGAAAAGSRLPKVPQLYEIGALVHVPRRRGEYESEAYVLAYDSARGLYVVEVEARGSGQCKCCTADFMSAEPLGERWRDKCAGASAVSDILHPGQQ